MVIYNSISRKKFLTMLGVFPCLWVRESEDILNTWSLSFAVAGRPAKEEEGQTSDWDVAILVFKNTWNS